VLRYVEMVVLKNSVQNARYVRVIFYNEAKHEDTHMPELDSRHMGIETITSSELRLLRSASSEVGAQGFDTGRLRGIYGKDNVVARWNAFVW